MVIATVALVRQDGLDITVMKTLMNVPQIRVKTAECAQMVSTHTPVLVLMGSLVVTVV
jgi:hypothetical protein